jgi:hypothetical protein
LYRGDTIQIPGTIYFTIISSLELGLCFALTCVWGHMNISGRKIIQFTLAMIMTAVLYQNCGPGFSSGQSATFQSFDVFGSRLSCDVSLNPSESPLKRLSKNEYFNSLEDLLDQGNVSDLKASLQDSLNIVPTDSLGNFINMDDTISQNHINGYQLVADQLSEAIASQAQYRQAFMNAYAGCSTFDQACIRRFIEGFGLWTFRRPLTTEQVNRYINALAGQNEELVEEIIYVFLQSPQFIFHVEVDGQEIAGNPKALFLDNYEMISRLSYAFWERMPDETLFQLAANSNLQTDVGLEQALQHVFSPENSNKVQAGFRNFYRQWLKLSEFENFQFNPSTPRYETFLDGIQPNVDGMIQEVEDMIEHYTWTGNGDLFDILTNQRSFAQDRQLASIYGVQPWSGDSNDVVTLPQGERAGLLTRAFFHVSPDEKTHPIHRAVFIRRQILCDDIPAPPADLPPDALLPPEEDYTLTTRQRYDAKTSPSSCVGCHSLINPVGFALENFDAIGRFRNFETVFDSNDEPRQLPIDTVVEPKIPYQSTDQVNGPVELSYHIANSGKADECFATQWWRYTFRRMEKREDHCAIEQVRDTLISETGSLVESLKQIARSRDFRQRHWSDNEE